MDTNIRKHLHILLFLLISAYNVSASTLDAASPSSTSKEHKGHDTTFIVEACLIPLLVILSGTLAGLTLGYMSLDETQLRVLSVSGTPKQREYARKIEPIRRNGHLLLTTLLLGNMIVNETLPVLSENVLGGGIQAVVVSTILIVVFAEIIPQSLCSRFGLQIGAYMATPTRFLIYLMFVVAWPIAKLLEFVLGPHHGIVYRRDELKELINIHSAVSAHGGDLNSDTVTIVGGALDFQEKKVMDAMTPIQDVFMLSIESRLDYETLAKVVRSGHSRVPVYEESAAANGHITKKIIGILLVKQCVLLDPEDATPLRDIPLNSVPTVPFDEPLHSTLDRFQQGNSHMAVVSRIPSRTESKTKPGSVYEDAKVGLTRRFLNRVLGDSDSDSDSDQDEATTDGKGSHKKRPSRSRKKSNESNVSKKSSSESTKASKKPKREPSPKGAPAANWMQWNRMNALEQTMPSDAILPDANAEEFLAGLQRAPLGIITLEDVLEELIGEEILDEFDLKGAKALPASSYVPAEAQRAVDAANAKARAAAKNNITLKEKGDPLGATAGVLPTGTPNASTTNLRLAQGLRAIRLKAGGGASPAPGGPNAAGTAPGGKRSTAPSPLSVPAVATNTGSAEPGANAPPVAEKTLPGPLSAPAAIALPASAPGSAKLPTISLPPPPPFTAIAGGGNEGAVPEHVPMTRGGSKGATKKRAFKSLIGGESATPGLEKRSDPLGANKGGTAGVGPTATSSAPNPAAPKIETKVEPTGMADDGYVVDNDPKDKPRETNFEDKAEGE